MIKIVNYDLTCLIMRASQYYPNLAEFENGLESQIKTPRNDSMNDALNRGAWSKECVDFIHLLIRQRNYLKTSLFTLPVVIDVGLF